jgi:hypothetical protein
MLLVAVVGLLGGCSKKAEPVNAVPAAGDQAATVDPAALDGYAKTAVPVTPPDSNAEHRRTRPPARWAMWPIANLPSSGLPNPESYDLSGGWTVLDRVTGLMWQRRIDPTTVKFDAASARCEELRLGGYDDWRLPSRVELVSILDLAETQPSIDRRVFPDTPADWFWTSSVAADSPTAAWYVYFYFGYPNTEERRARFSVRCVRTEKPPAFTGNPDQHYEVNAATVRDLATGLRWQRILSLRTFSYPSAKEYCSHLDLDGHKDWRLPSMPELVSLVDERTSDPAIDSVAFPKTPAASFWTLSIFGNKGQLAWNVYFDRGRALYGPFTEPRRVRCVS